MTVGLDFQGDYTAIYQRLTTSAEGGAARTLLGTDAKMSAINGGTLKAFDLSVLERVKEANPLGPWAALDGGSTSPGGRREMSHVPYDWWISGPDKYALRGLLGAFDVLYKEARIATGVVTVGLIVSPTFSIVLGRYQARVRLDFSILR